jgi:glycosyltransferase involved in cell wall biosynthesis
VSRELPEVSVVIPVHNGGRTLGDQLQALAEQQDDVSFDVLVVDNNSTDETATVANRYRPDFENLRLLSASAGSGVAYARNYGARHVTTDVVLFCDADDLVRPGWISAMATALADYDIVGGRLDVTRINSEQVQTWTGHPPSNALPTTMKWRPYATGANLGVRMSVWRELNGFDESFVGGHEEVDFAWRAQDLGRTVGFAPGAVVDYRLRADVRGVCRQRYHYGRTYAQLYSRYRHRGIPRASAKHEAKVIGLFLLGGPREWRSTHGVTWLAGVAWTLGRWRGDVAYRVRCPL